MYATVLSHQYTNDCHLYVSLPVSAVRSNIIHSVMAQFSRCLHNVESWMSANRLRLNANKTAVLCLGSRHVTDCDIFTVHEVLLLSSTVNVDSSACDLGSQLTMSDHVACRLINICDRFDI